MYGFKIIRGAIRLFLLVFLGCTLYYTFIELDRNLAIGCLSVTIAILSIYLALSSERRMEAIAYATFDEAIREIEDRRLTLSEKMPIIDGKLMRRKIDVPGDKSELEDTVKEFAIYFQFSIWKCKTYLDRAMNFREYLRPEDREQIVFQIHELFSLFVTIKKALNHTLLDSYKGNLQNIYDTIKEFDKFHEKEERKQKIIHNLKFLKDE